MLGFVITTVVYGIPTGFAAGEIEAHLKACGRPRAGRAARWVLFLAFFACRFAESGAVTDFLAAPHPGRTPTMPPIAPAAAPSAAVDRADTYAGRRITLAEVERAAADPRFAGFTPLVFLEPFAPGRYHGCPLGAVALAEGLAIDADGQPAWQEIGRVLGIEDDYKCAYVSGFAGHGGPGPLASPAQVAGRADGAAARARFLLGGGAPR